MIIIIGAGLAGLSAAYRLLCHGGLSPNEILIVESKCRIGGRVESLYLEDGLRIDLGAQWLHGEKNNPIYDWLKCLDCIEGPEVEDSEFQGNFALPSGQPAPNDVVARVLDILMEAKDLLYKLAHTLDQNARPIDIFRKHIEKEKSRCPLLRNADADLVRSIERWFELYEMIDNSCEDMSLLSIKSYANWINFDDGKMMILKGGWQGVVKKLVDLIGLDKIMLESSVEQIHYEDSGVVLSIRNNLDNIRRLECDHVIITCSVGVLKSIGNDFFVPPLDSKRQRAFINCGYYVANKIFLQFDKPFLQEGEGLKLLWPDSNESRIDLPEWTRYITGFDLINGTPNVLLGWIGGRGAAMIESVSDQEVGQVCLRIFKIFLPQKKPPNLIFTKRSAWASDKNIRGSYSYASIKSLDDSDDIWEPVFKPSVSNDEGKVQLDKSVPRLLFAGEATAKNLHATAHGAIVSGFREADRILEFRKSMNYNLSRNLIA